VLDLELVVFCSAIYLFPVPLGMLLGNVLLRGYRNFRGLLRAGLTYILFTACMMATLLLCFIFISGGGSSDSLGTVFLITSAGIIFFSNLWFWYYFPIRYSCEWAYLQSKEDCPKCHANDSMEQQYLFPGLADSAIFGTIIRFLEILGILALFKKSRKQYRCTHCDSVFTGQDLLKYVTSRHLQNGPIRSMEPIPFENYENPNDNSKE
jgi:hypothetical protein